MCSESLRKPLLYTLVQAPSAELGLALSRHITYACMRACQAKQAATERIDTNSICSHARTRQKIALHLAHLSVCSRTCYTLVASCYRQWQLLKCACVLAAEGFGVGHTRSTQTKGVWVWGEPQKLTPSANTTPDSTGQDASIVYLDTEGFESTGKADAYDDRIFALSTLISAVLVYNLPETVRESDIQKLSFAVELAEGFYADVQVCAVCCSTGVIAPASALLSWFLFLTQDTSV